jgi:hypothetical protein
MAWYSGFKFVGFANHGECISGVSASGSLMPSAAFGYKPSRDFFRQFSGVVHTHRPDVPFNPADFSAAAHLAAAP